MLIKDERASAAPDVVVEELWGSRKSLTGAGSAGNQAESWRAFFTVPSRQPDSLTGN